MAPRPFEELLLAAPLFCKPESIEAQFWSLVRAERDRAVRLAWLMTRDPEAARDIAQEAFFRAYRALPRFRGESRLSTWFFRILINQVKNHRRHCAFRLRWLERWFVREEATEPGQQRCPAALPDERAAGREICRRIARAMDSLSLSQRMVFTLVHLEGNTVVETADLLDVSAGSVKIHLHRALVKLRRQLRDLAPENPEASTP